MPCPPMPGRAPYHLTPYPMPTFVQACAVLGLLAVKPVLGADAFAPLPTPAPEFIEQHCASCHDDVEKKGGLHLTELSFRPD